MIGKDALIKAIRIASGGGGTTPDPADLRLHWDVDDSDLAFVVDGNQGGLATDIAVNMSEYHTTRESTTDTAILMSDYHTTRESTTDTATLMSDFHTTREATVDVAIILSE